MAQSEVTTPCTESYETHLKRAGESTKRTMLFGP